jgi:hypothetical protein
VDVFAAAKLLAHVWYLGTTEKVATVISDAMFDLIFLLLLLSETLYFLVLDSLRSAVQPEGAEVIAQIADSGADNRFCLLTALLLKDFGEAEEI